MPSLDSLHDGNQQSWSNVSYSWKSQKSINFMGEGRTSMSARSNEMITFLEKLTMCEAFCKVFGHGRTFGTAENLCFVGNKKVYLKHYTHEKIKKSDAFASEVRTSMSPRSNENATFLKSYRCI